METLAQIVAEMERKPDAHVLVEWIDDFCRSEETRRWPGDPDALLRIRDAIASYFDALEGQD